MNLLDLADDDGDDVDEYTLMMGSSPELSSSNEQYGARAGLARHFSEYRVLEFGCTLVMFGLALFFSLIPVQQRPIPNVEVQINSTTTVWSRDPTLNAKVHPEQVTTEVLVLFGVTVPVAVNLLMNYVFPTVLKVRLVPHDTRDYLLALAQAASMSELLTEFTKNLTGRFRPNFHDMCGWQYDVVWDGITNLCTDPVGEKEGLEVVDLSVDGDDSDAVISSLAARWLPYERDVVEELYTQDGVLVMGRGLGLLRVLASFVRLYCSPRCLVLCLNANEQAATLRRLVLTLGLDRRLLPRVVDARNNLNERQQMYKRGGVFFVTARILVVDLLSNHVDPGSISGLLVNDAHHVTETSIEAFILRLYRERNRDGFIKGFCDDSVALSSGFNRVEQVLKHLYVRNVFLYPRFHVAVNSCLEKHQPEVYEIEVAFSPSMKIMQEALLVALEATVKELQRNTKSLDAADLTMDKALAKYARQITMNGQQRFPSPWLFTDAADRLLTAAKERLYQVVDPKTNKPINLRLLGSSNIANAGNAQLKLVLEQNSKWDALKEILDEVHDEQKKRNRNKEKLAAGGANVLVMIKDERTEIQREKRAFDKLIHQKAHLMMPANVYDLPLHMKLRQQTVEYSMDTRTGGRAKSHRAGVKVVVDVREFRSALPSMLHKEGLFVLPVTLEIGDYVLSPEICVERKSISDLFGSLNSGRLFNQAESMRRFYKTPVLLIEFTQGKAFSLQDVSELGPEINATNIVSKLTLLILHFPSLRILWSRSPHATVDLFKIVKKYQDEPNMEAAAALGNGLPMDDSAAQVNSGEGGLASNYYNTSSMDVLKKLPGINEHNFRKVLASVKNLAELSRLTLDKLTELLGKTNGKKLHTFFNSTA
ncbi:DNA repair endonuclease XPF [Phytophthora palmivora]|uniref:DNA repair endonuclease XPF n=1 Tax=Phytophthora palmivora TaxID=4796 RepID=A0A2P4WZS7_9STRA|nr:DNA repair endonuclease XPF [Phytophthora palmivora]